MPQAVSDFPEDPFAGLLLPMEAWKAIDEAHITGLEQLKALAPLISQLPGIDPEIAEIIKDRLERMAAGRMAARRTIRVRFIFPKRPYRKPGRRRAQGNRRSPIQTGGRL
jgi:hypothetical protein